MNILVTGGAGYLGTMVSRNLLVTGHNVTVFDNLLKGTAGLKSLLGFRGFHFCRGDIRTDVLPTGFDAIVHLAAIVGEEQCNVSPEQAYEVNVDGTKNVIGQAGLAHIVFSSTCSNYGVTNGMATESTPLNPLSIYAETKIEGEELVREAQGTVLRLATISGLSPKMRFDLLINRMALDAARGKPIAIYGADAWRPFLHIQSAAKAIHEALFMTPEIYNVVGENIKKGDLVNLNSFIEEEDLIMVSKGTDDERNYRVDGKRFRTQSEFMPWYGIVYTFREVYGAAKQGVFD